MNPSLPPVPPLIPILSLSDAVSSLSNNDGSAEELHLCFGDIDTSGISAIVSDLDPDAESTGSEEEEDWLLQEVDNAENKWEEAPPEVVQLRNTLLELNFETDVIESIETISLQDFVDTFLLCNSTRHNLLTEVLKMVYDGADFWHTPSGTFGELVDKCVWACKHWGIERRELVVRGISASLAQVEFWKKVVKGVDRMAKTSPEKAKGMLESDFSQNENHLEWKDVVNSCLEAAMDKRICVQVPHILNMDALLNNGMLDGSFMKKLKVAVRNVVDGLGYSEDYVLQDATTTKHLEELVARGNLICELCTEYIDFMESNENFTKNKTEFIVFHSDEVMIIMTRMLKMHREFMTSMLEFQKPFDDVVVEDDPDWIP